MDYNNRITHHNILWLNDNEVFVFGSNTKGIHGKGAAKIANIKFGAKYGIGNGPSGKSYGIPTKGDRLNILPLSEISKYVDEFIKYCIKNPNSIFLVTEIGCGLANYKPMDIAPLFKEAIDVENIHMPKKFWEILINDTNEIL